MTDSLKHRTIKGMSWSAADAFLGQGVTFLFGIVLANILSPQEYGLIGIVTIFTTILTGLVDSGLSNALIRKADASNADFDTLFIANISISVFLYLVLYFCSPLIALFFSKPELTSLLRVMGVILLIQAFSIVQVTILSKNIDFRTKTKASLVSAIISGIVGICMAFSGLGVWSLVGLNIVKQLFYSICLWRFNKWRPSFMFSRNSFFYMWGFGSKLMLSGLLNNIWNQLYQVVVAKFYSPSTLGQYSRAKEYSNIFSSNLTLIVQRVTYPVLSEIQDDGKRLVSAYRKIIKITMFVTAICMIPLGAISEPLIYCLIGRQWYQATTFLPLICLTMSLYPLHSINLNMLQVQGRSDILLILEIVKKIIAIGPICLGIFVGIYWMLVGSFFTSVISFFLNSFYTGKSLKYGSFMQLKDILPAYGIAFLVAFSVYFIKYLPLSSWLILLIQLMVGSFVFLLICHFSKNEEYIEIKKIVLKFVLSKDVFKRCRE